VEFFLVNPNPGEGAKLPKNRFEQEMGKIRDKKADLPKSVLSKNR
jgi:hypothetical protein